MVTQEDIAKLAKRGDVKDVKALARKAAEAGQKQVAIDLYRCLEKTWGGTQVDDDKLHTLAQRPVAEPEMADA